MELRIDLNEPKILEKITSDGFGMLVSKKWKDLIDPYTPKDTGQLMGVIGGLIELQPFKIWYKSDYSEIVYYNNRGVTFITIGNGRNPYATDHWDKKAEQAGQKDKLYRALNSALESGRI